MTSKRWLIRNLLAASSALLMLSAVGCNSAQMHEMQETWRSNWKANQDRFEHANAEWNATYEQKFHEDYNRRLRPSQYRLDPVLPDPPPDAATTARAWDTNVYRYPNGSVSAYPTYTLVNYEDAPQWLEDDYVYAATQPGIVIADIIMLPVLLFVEPPWIDLQNHGARYAPSMTVAPPLPPPGAPAPAPQQQ
jgi:hypothetical protein